MKNRLYTYIVAGMAIITTVLLASCVKDDLYNTPHPNSGAVVVTTEWNGKSTDAIVPQQYTLRIDEHEQNVSGEKNVFDRLLAPGNYILTVHNTPDQMTINGNVALVNTVSSGTISPTPGYQFASTQTISVVADDTLCVTAQMRQLTRRLDLELTATEGDYSRVQTVVATISGVASVVDLASGKRSVMANVTDMFKQDGNKFTLFFRLLGIVETEAQTLTMDITFNNGDTQRIVSNIADAMSGFNDGVTPKKLTGNLLLPIEAGLTGGTITGWNETDGGKADAN